MNEETLVRFEYMKKQKRDLTQRAYSRGYTAGLTGKSKTLCPNATDAVQQTWLNGWRQGREDNWNGMIGVAGIHRMPGIST